MHLLFFFNDTATTEIYTLSLHDALPILLAASGLLDGRRATTHWASIDWLRDNHSAVDVRADARVVDEGRIVTSEIGRSTRLNSSHANISYAVFCLKKKKHSNSSVSFITF